MDSTAIFDADLIRRYDRAGPRYTSYPTAVHFREDFTEAHYRAIALDTNRDLIPHPLSLYFHIPFCSTVCFYCACNKVVTKDRTRAIPYLKHLHQEMAMQARLFDRDRTVEQLHWGGGTPTFLSTGQMRALMRVTGELFTLRDDDQGEYSIELDPREADADTLTVLREIGFNRISLGVQDFDPRVQKAVNRIQGEAETVALMENARRDGFRSINVDLIYGLPHQTVERFDRTLGKVIAAGPDRLSIFNYAHLPERFKPQRRIHEADLPSPDEKLAILQHTIERLTGAGYVYIGMDHFAKPDDELAIAQRNGTLTRNFQGYSTHGDCDLVGIGVSAIGKVGDSYSQNAHALDVYYQHLDKDKLPIIRGIVLNDDDRLRRKVIEQIICHFKLDIEKIEHEFGINFFAYFAPEGEELKTMAADGLIALDKHTIRVLPPGRLLVRHVCMVFDAYERQRQGAPRFSKII